MRKLLQMLTYQCWNILWCDLLNIMVIQLHLQQLKKVMIPIPVKQKRITEKYCPTWSSLLVSTANGHWGVEFLPGLNHLGQDRGTLLDKLTPGLIKKNNVVNRLLEIVWSNLQYQGECYYDSQEVIDNSNIKDSGSLCHVSVISVGPVHEKETSLVFFCHWIICL